MRLKIKVTAALSATALVLTGCAGTSSVAASGTFYGATAKSGDPAIITVEGDTVTWGEFYCDALGEIDKNDSDTSTGTLDKDRVTLAWTDAGRFSGTDPFTESEDGSVITMSGGTYSQVGTAAATAILDERETRCEKDAESRAKQAEINARWEQEKPAFAKTTEAIIDALDSGELSGQDVIAWPEHDSAAQFFMNTEMTLDELINYVENRIGLPYWDFFGELTNGSDQARDFLEKLLLI